MKTVIIDTKCYSFGRSTDGKIMPVTDADYKKYFTGKALQDRIKENSGPNSEIRIGLNKAKFIYDPRLWKWTVKRNTYELSLWLRLTFVDDDNEGKNVFMAAVRKTGILQWSIIVKPYG